MCIVFPNVYIDFVPLVFFQKKKHNIMEKAHEEKSFKYLRVQKRICMCCTDHINAIPLNSQK